MMLTTVADDQEQEDVSSTASDRDMSPRWLKLCKKKSKMPAMWTVAQEMFDLNALHRVKITITTDSGVAVSAVSMKMFSN